MARKKATKKKTGGAGWNKGKKLTGERLIQQREIAAKARDTKLRKRLRHELPPLVRDSAVNPTLNVLYNADIVQFARDILGLTIDGFPLMELILRCSEGLPLPTDKLKTFVEVPSDGFAVKEVELTWPEYFAECSMGVKKYKPGKKPRMILVRAGRRSSKSTSATVKALFVGTRRELRQHVMPNEIMRIPILATSQDQAEAIIKQRCHEVLKAAHAEWLIGPMDPELHQNQVTNDTLPLITGTEIVAMPCNSKRVRGEASPLVEFDEYMAFAVEGRKKDKDIRTAACGSQAQFPNSQFMAIGTPLAEQGDFYELEKQAANNSSILAFHAPSWFAAPHLYRNNPDFYHNAFRTDPQGFDQEYRANYASAVEGAFREDDVDACSILAGEVPYDPICRYGAGIDQSGLSGRDRFAMAVAYYDPVRDVAGLAYYRSWAISELDIVMSDCRAAFQRYGCYEAMVDRYAGGYVQAALAKVGIQAQLSPKSAELVISLRQLMVARKLELPIDDKVKRGLLRTELVYSDTAQTPRISHPRDSKGHGDIIDALLRAVRMAVAGNFGRNSFTEEESLRKKEIEAAEAAYDPLAL